MKKGIIFCLFLLILALPFISAVSDERYIIELTKINLFLEDNLGKDFIENYVGEPIINPVLDPAWDSYDQEKVKAILNKDPLPIPKEVIVYPINIDGVESSFRVIKFKDDSFYSELTNPVKINIGKEKAIELAKEKGLEEPYKIILTTTDDVFSWSLISTKNSEEMKKGNVSQVTIDLRTEKITSNTFNPVSYDENSKSNILPLLLAILGVILLITIIYVYRRKNVEKN